MSTDRIIESARRVAAAWKKVDLDDISRDALGEAYEVLVPTMDLLDELADRCSAPEVVHTPTHWKHVMRGRPENGYQPEVEYLWSCACREGQSDDMGESVWAKQAVDKHIADPTQFPGWPS